jgi:hypothetical protein
MANKSGRKSASPHPSIRDRHNSAHGKAGLAKALRRATTLEDLEKAYGILEKISGASSKTRRQWATTYEVCKKALEGKANPLPKAEASEALADGAAQRSVPALAQEEGNPNEDDSEE